MAFCGLTQCENYTTNGKCINEAINYFHLILHVYHAAALALASIYIVIDGSTKLFHLFLSSLDMDVFMRKLSRSTINGGYLKICFSSSLTNFSFLNNFCSYQQKKFYQSECRMSFRIFLSSSLFENFSEFMELKIYKGNFSLLFFFSSPFFCLSFALRLAFSKTL